MRASTLFSASLLAAALPLSVHAKSSSSSSSSNSSSSGSGSGGPFTNARFTFYDVGVGACGEPNQPSDFIVALNAEQYGSGYPGPNCGKEISISYNGKTHTATIMDECMGCPYGGLDFSRGLFDYFADEAVGVIYGSWSFTDGSGSGGGGGGGGSSTSTSGSSGPTSSGSGGSGSGSGDGSSSSSSVSSTSAPDGSSSTAPPDASSTSSRTPSSHHSGCDCE